MNEDLERILAALESRKGLDVTVLDMREVVSYADFVVLCSGTSTTHVAALVGSVQEEFKGTGSPRYVNSSKDDSWWILDFVDIVVHVFKEDIRRFYDLEGLWADAKRLEK